MRYVGQKNFYPTATNFLPPGHVKPHAWEDIGFPNGLARSKPWRSQFPSQSGKQSAITSCRSRRAAGLQTPREPWCRPVVNGLGRMSESTGLKTSSQSAPLSEPSSAKASSMRAGYSRAGFPAREEKVGDCSKLKWLCRGQRPQDAF
jgi:hypothetical protein